MAALLALRDAPRLGDHFVLLNHRSQARVSAITTGIIRIVTPAPILFASAAYWSRLRTGWTN
jgi:hypothetical protein